LNRFFGGFEQREKILVFLQAVKHFSHPDKNSVPVPLKSAENQSAARPIEAIF